LTPGSRCWAGLALVLAAGALLLGGADPLAFDWQPARAAREPWRAWSAIGVHYSALHLGANLAGCALVAALGIAARLPGAAAWAWLAALPLTQLGLLARPDLAHYGGLSGVLHAGAGVVAVYLLDAAPRPRRWIGLLLLLGLTAKVVGEAPWGAALRHPAGWDIATAPFAHASGLAAGLACAAAALAWQRRASGREHAASDRETP
jgi:rhomboid family GlyGly-CTERM serine protease